MLLSKVSNISQTVKKIFKNKAIGNKKPDPSPLLRDKDFNKGSHEYLVNSCHSFLKFWARWTNNFPSWVIVAGNSSVSEDLKLHTCVQSPSSGYHVYLIKRNKNLNIFHQYKIRIVTYNTNFHFTSPYPSFCRHLRMSMCLEFSL